MAVLHRPASNSETALQTAGEAQMAQVPRRIVTATSSECVVPARGVHPFWVPDRLWRGKLPECFATVVLDDHTRFEGRRRWDPRRRPQRRSMYEMLMRRGKPDELIDWIDGALLVDLCGGLRIPQVIHQAWDPIVDLAGNGPVERPWYGLPVT